MPPVQPPLGMRPGPPGVIGHQPPVAPAQPPPPSEEPPSKKQKTEDNLIPEDVFLQKNKVLLLLSCLYLNFYIEILTFFKNIERAPEEF